MSDRDRDDGRERIAIDVAGPDALARAKELLSGTRWTTTATRVQLIIETIDDGETAQIALEDVREQADGSVTVEYDGDETASERPEIVAQYPTEIDRGPIGPVAKDMSDVDHYDEPLEHGAIQPDTKFAKVLMALDRRREWITAPELHEILVDLWDAEIAANTVSSYLSQAYEKGYVRRRDAPADLGAWYEYQLSDRGRLALERGRRARPDVDDDRGGERS